MITGEINASSGKIGGFTLKNSSLVCEEASLTIGYSTEHFTRKVVLDAKTCEYDKYNFALSVVNYGVVTYETTPMAGIYINVGIKGDRFQSPGIVMENGTFVGFRVPIIPFGDGILNLGDKASPYVSGMYIFCRNSKDLTITLPTSTRAKQGDVFTVIRAGTGNVTIKAPTGTNYYVVNAGGNVTNGFTSTTKKEHIHFIFDGGAWYSECSGD